MLRLAASRSSRLVLSGVRNACTDATASEGSSVAKLIAEVKAKPFSLEGLSALKASTIATRYPTAAPAPWSVDFKLLLAGLLTVTYLNADRQARSHDWIVDLSLDVLQSAWWISWFSFLPFRSIFVSLRGIAPHTASPIVGFKSIVGLKP